MGVNEFGVESNSTGGFGAGVGDNFEEMFEQISSASVVDDEVAETSSRSSRRAARQEEAQPTFTPEPEPSSFAPSPSFEDFENEVTEEEQEPYYEPDPEPISGFDRPEDTMGSFEDFGQDSVEQSQEPEHFEDDYAEQASEAQDEHSFEGTSWVDPALDLDGPAPYGQTSSPTPSTPSAPSFNSFEEPTAVSSPTPAYSQPPVEQPRVVEPPRIEPQAEIQSTPERQPEPRVQLTTPPKPITEDDVDYIERVIRTSDALRALPDEDGKAVNMVITAGQPVASHQELVLIALRTDRQILKTAEAILEAKAKKGVDRAFYILGLDEDTFVDFGKTLSHDLDSKVTVVFEGDKLKYARDLVDVVEELTPVSVQRFDAVKSVLGAGELGS